MVLLSLPLLSEEYSILLRCLAVVQLLTLSPSPVSLQWFPADIGSDCKHSSRYNTPSATNTSQRSDGAAQQLAAESDKP